VVNLDLESPEPTAVDPGETAFIESLTLGRGELADVIETLYTKFTGVYLRSKARVRTGEGKSAPSERSSSKQLNYLDEV